MGEAITEGDNTMGEVVLRQPGYHTVLLHVRPASYIHNQVARVLPVPVRWKPLSSTIQSDDQSSWPGGLQFLPDHVHSASAHLGVAAHDGDTGCERAVNAEDHGLGASGNHSQTALGIGVVAPRAQGGMA